MTVKTIDFKIIRDGIVSMSNRYSYLGNSPDPSEYQTIAEEEAFEFQYLENEYDLSIISEEFQLKEIFIYYTLSSNLPTGCLILRSEENLNISLITSERHTKAFSYLPFDKCPYRWFKIFESLIHIYHLHIIINYLSR